MQIAVSFFGADVGKAEIVVADHGRAKPVTKILKNTPSSLSKWLQTLHRCLSLLRHGLTWPTAKGLPACILHRAARPIGSTIARFIASEHERLHPYQPCAQYIERLRQMLRLRRMAVITRTQLRLSSERHHQVHDAQAQVQKALDALTELANSLEDQMLAEIQAEPALAQDFKLLTSIVGVGNLTATALVTTFARIPFNPCIAGLDPRRRGPRQRHESSCGRCLRALLNPPRAARSITFKPMYQALLPPATSSRTSLPACASPSREIATFERN